MLDTRTLVKKYQNHFRNKVYNTLASDMKHGMSKSQIQRKYKQMMFKHTHTVNVWQAFIMPLKRFAFWAYFLIYLLVTNLAIFGPISIYQNANTPTATIYSYMKRHHLIVSNFSSDNVFLSKHFIPWDYVEVYTYSKFFSIFLLLVILFYMTFVIIEWLNMPTNKQKIKQIK